MKRMLVGAVAALVLTGTTVGAAPKGGGASSEPSTIILNAPALAASTISWEPHLGDYVNFTVTYPKSLDNKGVRIQVLCYQDGNPVYAEAGPYSQDFLLGGAMSDWFLSGGSATCHADLYYWSYNGGQKFNLLASTNFDSLGR